MPRIVIVCGATFAIVTIVVSSLLANDEAHSKTTVRIDVGDFYFCNASFQGGVCETNITAGDTVIWTWVGAPHTVTQCETGFINCPPTGGFDSGFQSPIGGTFSHTFDSAGSFEYRCNLHSREMRGRVNVATRPATPTASVGQMAPTQADTAVPAASDAQRAAIETNATATGQTGAAASIPDTGGTPSDDGSSWPLIPALAGGIFLIALAGAGIAVQRRH